MEFQIRKAEPADVRGIMRIMEQAGKCLRDAGLDIGLPEAELIVQLLRRQPDLFGEERENAGVEVLAEIVFKRVCLCVRADLLPKFTEAGKINGCGAVDQRVVVGQHQTFVAPDFLQNPSPPLHRFRPGRP